MLVHASKLAIACEYRGWLEAGTFAMHQECAQSSGRHSHRRGINPHAPALPAVAMTSAITPPTTTAARPQIDDTRMRGLSHTHTHTHLSQAPSPGSHHLAVTLSPRAHGSGTVARFPPPRAHPRSGRPVRAQPVGGRRPISGPRAHTAARVPQALRGAASPNRPTPRPARGSSPRTASTRGSTARSRPCGPAGSG